MKNKTITIYELLGLIKEGKAPKKVKHKGIIYILNEVNQDYENLEEEYDLIADLCLNHIHWLNRMVEILDETDDEFEDIEEITSGERNIHSFDNTQIRTDIDVLIDYINKLIRNQKKIIERLNGEDNE
jgi:hypothetical protein